MVTLYVPPAVPVFPAGYDPLPSDFANWITDTIGFQAQGIVFRATAGSGQSLTSSGTILSFGTIQEDPYGGWSASATSSQPANSWLAPYTGWYQAEVFCSVSAAALNLQVAVLVDGTTSYTTSQAGLSSGTSGGGQAFAWVFLVGGTDYVQAQATPSATKNTDTSALGRQPTFSVTYISS